MTRVLHCARRLLKSAMRHLFVRRPDRRPSGSAQVWSVLLAAALVVGTGLVAPEPIAAHSFLIQSDPPAGSRLTASPTQVTLRFTEAVAVGKLTIRTNDGIAIPAPAIVLRNDRLLLVAVLQNTLPDGLYLVSYEVLSVDGHTTASEYAFAIGGSGTVANAPSDEAGPEPGPAFARWLLLIGLLVAFGGLVSELMVWRPIARANAAIPPALPTGRLLLISLIGGVGLVAMQILGLIELGGADLGSLLGSRATIFTAIGTGLVVVAGIASTRAGSRPLAAALLGIALGLVVLAGHAGDGTPLTAAADLVHVGAVAVWAGGLALVVRALWRARAVDRTGWLMDAIRRYANLALGAVLIAILSGIVVATTELRGIEDLTGTLYGRLLVLKGIVVGCALLIALLARVRLGGWVSSSRLGLRRLTGAESGGVLGAIAVAAVLASSGPPASTGVLLGPPPLLAPVTRQAGLAGSNAIFVAASSAGLQVQAIMPSEGGDPTAAISVEAQTPNGDGLTLNPRTCGPGCWTMAYSWPSGTTVLTIDATSAEWGDGTVSAPVMWPPRAVPDDALAAVVAKMRRVQTFTLDERVTSGPGMFGAGTHKFTGADFIAGEPYAAGVATDIQMPSDAEITFFLPGSWIWVDLRLDGQGRIAAETIVDPGHHIERSFTYP
jgi:copper transport protein